MDWTPLKNISQLGWLFPIYGKIKNVPNHQPALKKHLQKWVCNPLHQSDVWFHLQFLARLSLASIIGLRNHVMAGGTPKKWWLIMGNPNLKWMMNRGPGLWLRKPPSGGLRFHHQQSHPMCAAGSNVGTVRWLQFLAIENKYIYIYIYNDKTGIMEKNK